MCNPLIVVPNFQRCQIVACCADHEKEKSFFWGSLKVILINWKPFFPTSCNCAEQQVPKSCRCAEQQAGRCKEVHSLFYFYILFYWSGNVV